MDFIKKIYHKILKKIAKDMNRLNYNDELYKRVFDYYRNRWNAIDDITDYLVGAEIPCDYCEFGVFQGTTFSYAYKMMHPIFKSMKFFAFDSFSGLPKPKGIDKLDRYSSSFYEGQFEYSEEMFISKLKEEHRDISKIISVKGWFNEILNSELTKKYGIQNIAVAWVDCDLYESTVPVLEYITDKVVTGSVVVFDDWHCYRNLPDFGEQRACREWLEKNPDIVLHNLLSFGSHGVAFTVEKIIL